MQSILKSGLKVAALALVLCAGTTAFAQGGGGGGRAGGGGGGFGMMGGQGGRMQELGISSRDVESFGKILSLSDDQSKSAKELYDGYLAGYTAKADVARKEFDALREEAREAGDFEVMRTKGPAIWTKLTEARKDVEKNFMGDLKALLTPEQAKSWPKVEMAHRREASRGGFAGPGVSGERVDLFRVLDKVEVPADAKPQVTSVLDAYEVEYDRELVKRTEITEKATAAITKAMQTAEPGDFGAAFQDPEIQKLFTEGREQAIKVRDVNRKYARQLQSLLPANQGEAFDTEFRKESFPQIYRARYAQTALNAAAKFEDLDASQKSSLTSLTETYTRESNTLNKSGEEAQEKQEREFSPANMGQRGGGADDPMRALRDQRRELETKTVESLKAMLTEAQRAKLPADTTGQGGGGNNRRTGNNNGNNPGAGNNNNNGGGGNNGNNPQRRNRGNRNPGNPQPAPGNN